MTNVVLAFDNIGNHVIEPVQCRFMSSPGRFVQRTQFPLLLCYAMTIHKSQGLTLPSVFVDLESGMHSKSMAYVALSRTRRLQDLHIIRFDPTQFVCDELCVHEYDKLRQKFNEQTHLHHNYHLWVYKTFFQKV